MRAGQDGLGARHFVHDIHNNIRPRARACREGQRSLILPSLAALGASLAGMVLGQLVRGRIKAETFQLCFFIGLLLLGAHLALRGLL
jgi:hypothetical protein